MPAQRARYYAIAALLLRVFDAATQNIPALLRRVKMPFDDARVIMLAARYSLAARTMLPKMPLARAMPRAIGFDDAVAAVLRRRHFRCHDMPLRILILARVSRLLPHATLYDCLRALLRHKRRAC